MIPGHLNLNLNSTTLTDVTWDLSFSSACTVHDCALKDACSDCGRPLKWQGSCLDRCVCTGGNLASIRPVPIQATKLDGLRVANGLLGVVRHGEEADEAKSMVPLRGLPPVEALTFIFRLGMDLIGGHRRKMFSLRGSGELAAPPHEALNLGLHALRAWPAAFLSVPEIVKQHRGPSASGTRALWIAAVERWLGGLLPNQAKAVREALEVLKSQSGKRLKRLPN